MDKFENWFNKVNEELTESPAINTEVASVADVEVDADRSNMIGDIDTIMTSLETLASELTEELAIDLEDLNEAGTKDFIKSWIIGIKATKSQEKVKYETCCVQGLRLVDNLSKDRSNLSLKI